jgi:MFS family permease
MRFFQYLQQNLPICIGNIAEWYDLSLYVVSSVIFGHLFFPSFTSYHQTLLTMLIFAAGIVARNLGGWFFGRLTIIINPKTVYRIIVRMCILSTVMIALLPTYNQIGAAAGALLLMLRMLQGFSSGAQYPGALSMLYGNNANPAKGCALAHITSLFGYFLAAIVFMITKLALTHPHFIQFGWRLCFASSLLLMYLVHKVSPMQQKDWDNFANKAQSAIPLTTIIGKQAYSFTKVILISSVAGILYFTNFVFFAQVLGSFTTLSHMQILCIQTISWITSCISVWIFAGLIRNKNFIKNIVYGYCAIIISALCIPELIHFSSIASCITASLLLITSNSLIISGIAPYYCAQFSESTRFSATALAYNLGTTISALAAVAISSYAIKTHNIWNYSFILVAAAMLGILLCKKHNE